MSLIDDIESKRRHAWRDLYAKTANAENWREAHRWTPDDFPDRIALDLREKLRLHPDSTVLEVGAASGELLSLILSNAQHGVGLDQCEPLIQRGARSNLTKRGVQLAVAEASHLPVENESFDRVFSYSVFQCFPSQRYAAKVLAEMVRACRVGGMIIVGDVFGVMEKQRRRICGLGVPEKLADGMLLPIVPLWKMRQRMIREGDGLYRRTYPRSFFRRLARRLGCRVEFLMQNIPGRVQSKVRFDVRMFKDAPGETNRSS